MIKELRPARGKFQMLEAECISKKDQYLNAQSSFEERHVKTEANDR